MENLNLSNIKYSCKYTDGGGTEYDGGVWEVKETPKTITFTLIEKPFYSLNFDSLKINKFKPNKHGYRSWEDGSYTIYPNQCGTPYYFEKL